MHCYKTLRGVCRQAGRLSVLRVEDAVQRMLVGPPAEWSPVCEWRVWKALLEGACTAKHSRLQLLYPPFLALTQNLVCEDAL